MPHLLFKLNGVPDDEAGEIRALLDEHHIHYYETDAGRFGISLAAIWLRDDGEIEQAHELLYSYQLQRYQQARADYEQQERDGTVETLLQRLWRHPLRSLLFIIAIIVVLYFSTMPFVMWLK